MPSPTFLVVKKGSKTRALIRSGIPGPVSVTRRWTQPSFASAERVRVPPSSFITATELLIRLNTICWYSRESPQTRGSPSGTSSTRWTLAVIRVFLAIPQTVRMQWRTSTVSSSPSVTRAKPRRFSTILRALFPLSSMTFRSS